MDKIEILLQKLDNRITSSLAKRLDALDDLQDKLEASGEDYKEKPTDENRNSYNEVIDYVEKMEEGIVRDLQSLLEKRNTEQLAKEQKANQPANAPIPNTSENSTTEKKEEKKEGTNVLTMIIGGALLVASFGAINYFRKR